MIDVTQVKIDGQKDLEIPRFCRIKQRIPDKRLHSVREAVRSELERSDLDSRVTPQSRVAIGVGSRGIDQLVDVIREVVAYLRERNCKPFLIPAMGSHGGASAAGQKHILENYGITESTVNAPLRASMEVVKLGQTADGVPIYFDKLAFNADAVIAVNRVKVHTDFSGEIESGIVKMLVIGFGKHRGAAAIHSYGFENFSRVLPQIGREIIQNSPIALGIGLLENGRDHLCEVRAWNPGEIISGEKSMLTWQKELLPEIPFDKVDILIIDEMGKDISGAGIDPNIIGRVKPIRADIGTIIVLDLTEKTSGNATGMGMVDLIPQKFFEKIDFNTTYTNLITAQMLKSAKLPLVARDERFALRIGLKVSNKSGKEVKIVRLKNTLEIEKMWISEGLLSAAKSSDDLEILSDLSTVDAVQWLKN